MTRAGRTLLIASLAVVIVSRLLGLDEVVIIGLCGLGLLAITALWMRVTRVEVDVTRRVSPSQVSAGDSVSVNLTILNSAHRRSPVLTLVDPVARYGDARNMSRAEVPVGPMRPDTRISAAYALDAEQRGMITVGPMRVTRVDPFGLLVHQSPGPADTQLIVLPRIDHVAAPGSGRGDDLVGVTARHRLPSATGEEFATLREYVPGDDLRKVHWATSARRDTLMVRRDDRPFQARCTVVLDVRAAVHDDVSFEVAVSAAASVIAAATARGDETRLVTTSGTDSLVDSGKNHLDVVLRDLAMVTTSPAGSFEATLGAVRQATNGGIIVAVTTTAATLPTLSTTRNRGQSSVSVLCPIGASEPPADEAITDDSTPHPTSSWNGRGHLIVTVDPQRGFAASWTALIGRPTPNPRRVSTR